MLLVGVNTCHIMPSISTSGNEMKGMCEGTTANHQKTLVISLPFSGTSGVSNKITFASREEGASAGMEKNELVSDSDKNEVDYDTEKMKKDDDTEKNDIDGDTEVTQTMRELTLEEKQGLEKDVRLVSDYKQQKFEREAQKNWDLFYKRNTTKFFKDRHWTKREFAELVQKQVQC